MNELEHPEPGWYNDETGQWDKLEPDMPAFWVEEQD